MPKYTQILQRKLKLEAELQSLREWQESSHDTEVQYLKGCKFYFSPPRDLKKALEHFKKAAGFNELSQYVLEIHEDRDQGTLREMESVIKLLQQRVEQPFSNTTFMDRFWLGKCYKFGTGCVVDQDRAKELLETCFDLAGRLNGAMVSHVCDEDDRLKIIATQYNELGEYYESEMDGQRDLKKAIELFHKAAELGNAKAQYYLGIFYKHGIDISKDVSKAVELFQKAAELGHTGARCHLGQCYEHGTGISKDLTKAVELYRNAAELGDGTAQYYLSICYSHGVGVQKNNDEAEKWLHCSAAQAVQKKISSHLKAQLRTFDFCGNPSSENFSLRIRKTSRDGEVLKVNAEITFPFKVLDEITKTFTSRFLDRFRSQENASEKEVEELFQSIIDSTDQVVKYAETSLEALGKIRKEEAFKKNCEALGTRFVVLRPNFYKALYLEGNSRDIEYVINCSIEDVELLLEELTNLNEALNSITRGNQQGRIENNRIRKERLEQHKKALEGIKGTKIFKELQEGFEKAYGAQHEEIVRGFQASPMSEELYQRVERLISVLENHVERCNTRVSEVCRIGEDVKQVGSQIDVVWESIKRHVRRRGQASIEQEKEEREQKRQKESKERKAKWESGIAKQEERIKRQREALEKRLAQEKALEDKKAQEKTEALQKQKENKENKANSENKEGKSESNETMAQRLLDLQRNLIPLHVVSSDTNPKREGEVVAASVRSERMKQLNPAELEQFCREEKLSRECDNFKTILERLSFNSEENFMSITERYALLYMLAHAMDRIVEMRGIVAFPMETANKMRNYIFHMQRNNEFLSLTKGSVEAVREVVLNVLSYLQAKLTLEGKKIQEAELLKEIHSPYLNKFLQEIPIPSLEVCIREISQSRKELDEYDRRLEMNLDPVFQTLIEYAKRLSQARRGAFSAEIRDRYNDMYHKHHAEYEIYIAEGRLLRHSVIEDVHNQQKKSKEDQDLALALTESKEAAMNQALLVSGFGRASSASMSNENGKSNTERSSALQQALQLAMMNFQRESETTTSACETAATAGAFQLQRRG